MPLIVFCSQGVGGGGVGADGGAEAVDGAGDRFSEEMGKDEAGLTIGAVAIGIVSSDETETSEDIEGELSEEPDGDVGVADG